MLYSATTLLHKSSIHLTPARSLVWFYAASGIGTSGCSIMPVENIREGCEFRCHEAAVRDLISHRYTLSNSGVTLQARARNLNEACATRISSGPQPMAAE